jgi:MFS family permease
LMAPALLALCRFGQGFGLGGEWGGAVLLATENAPPGKRAWYGMFPQLGAPLGFILSTGVFLLLTHFLDDADLFAWGWRLPFLASALLVIVGLWVRLSIEETPAFRRMQERGERVAIPLAVVLRRHGGRLVLGTFSAMATFVLFYLMTVFTLSWGTSSLGFSRERFLVLQMIGVLFFGATIPLSAWLADRGNARNVLIGATVGITLFGFVMAPMLGARGTLTVLLCLCLGLALMGFTYGPLGSSLAGLFPANIRYTGASLAFNLAGIVGASLAPFVATWLARNHGLPAVGAYLVGAGLITLVALLLLGPDAHEAEPVP